LFGLFKKKPQIIGGAIGYWGLSDWWLNSFNEVERQSIRDAYKPLIAGIGNEKNNVNYGVDKGNFLFSSGAVDFLTGLIGHLYKEEMKDIVFKVIDRINLLYSDDLHILVRHFALHQICRSSYRWRHEHEEALNVAIDACNRSILISKDAAQGFLKAYPESKIPGHHCFKQYAIIEEKNGNYAKAITLVKQAASDGWQGDWEQRLVRLNKKANKLNEGQS